MIRLMNMLLHRLVKKNFLRFLRIKENFFPASPHPSRTPVGASPAGPQEIR